MHFSKKVLGTEAHNQVDRHTIPLAGSLCRLGCAKLRAAVRSRRRSTSKQVAYRSPSPAFETQNPPYPNDDHLCRHHLNLVRQAYPSLLSSTCNLLEEGDVHILEGFPVSAGGFADIWRGSLDNRRVAIKSYRRYLCMDSSPIFRRFLQEALICSRLSHKNIVSFIGIYSTSKHPFSLVFDFAGYLDLKGYLKIHPTANRLELLVGIARGLDHMHDLDIVHGALQAGNILVGLDETSRIAGLGSALILDHTTPWAEMSVEWLFRGSAPELMHPEEFGFSSPRNSKAADVYAFGVLAWEVFTGRAVFPGHLDIVAAHTMWKGVRPPRPDHPQVTDHMWKLIEQCWERAPSERTTIKGVVRILEAERRAKLRGGIL